MSRAGDHNLKPDRIRKPDSRYGILVVRILKIQKMAVIQKISYHKYNNHGRNVVRRDWPNLLQEA